MSRGGEQQEMIDYHLGRLSPEAASALEMRYFENDDALDQLLVAREMLIRAYVRDELAAEDRARFERYFLTTPERRKEVALVRALRREIESPQAILAINKVVEEQVSGSRWWQGVLDYWRGYHWAIASLILFCGLGLWIGVKTLQDRPLPVARTTEPMPAPTISEPEIVSPDSPRSKESIKKDVPRAKSEVVVATLFPGLVRNEIAPKVHISTAARWLMARLVLDIAIGELESKAQYSAVLQTDDGKAVWQGDGYSARPSRPGAVVIIKIPAKNLETGEYRLQLSPKSENEALVKTVNYTFRIEKK